MAFLKGLGSSDDVYQEIERVIAANQSSGLFAILTALYDLAVNFKLEKANINVQMASINVFTELEKLTSMRNRVADLDTGLRMITEKFKNPAYGWSAKGYPEDISIAMFHKQMIEQGMMQNDPYFDFIYTQSLILIPQIATTQQQELATAQTQYVAIQSIVEGLRAQLNYLQILIAKEQEKQRNLLERANMLGIMV